MKVNTAYSILKVLVYFDLFHYPLKPGEIKSFLDQPADDDALNNTLNKLLETKQVFQLDEFYSLRYEPFLAERRRKGNAEAEKLLKKASGIAKWFYKFPYVRGVGVSGSVSKNYADENADIDYFIITKANRLWIARTLLHLFKKIPFLKNRHRYYCMNYFVDEAGLVIEEKNIYTATELFTLVPLAGNGSIKEFFYSNDWAFNFFPNRALPDTAETKVSEPLLKQFAEFLFSGRPGDWLDNYFLKLTTRRWNKKEELQKLNTKGEKMGLKTSKHYSKNSPAHFHDWFLEKYERHLSEMQKKWNLQDEMNPVYP